jgi:hypothetical protein
MNIDGDIMTSLLVMVFVSFLLLFTLWMKAVL